MVEQSFADNREMIVADYGAILRAHGDRAASIGERREWSVLIGWRAAEENPKK